MKPLSVKAKFQFGAGCILILYCVTAATTAYHFLKEMVSDEIYKETQLLESVADATRTYVKDILRPQVAALMPPDGFMPQAMSTSYVGREVMSRIRQRFPEFEYRRAAGNPMNPINQADEFENEMLRWFADNREHDQWQGMITKAGQAYYARMRAIYAESECLQCHGVPADSPADMKDIYGVAGGYGYREGDVVAADTIYIPVGFSFVRIKEAAWLTFLVASVSLFFLWVLFYLLFNRTVVLELKGLLSTFRNIPGPTSSDDVALPLTSGDEVDQLKRAFEITAHELQQTHNHLKASETKYRLMFETSQDTIIIIDAQERVRDINSAGIALFGFMNRAEALSMETYFQIFFDARDAANFSRAIDEEGFVNSLEVEMVDRLGDKMSIMVSATARRDENGGFAGITAMLRDVTEMRRMDQYLAQAEKLASIGQLASGVAHEINNPLGVIQCYANLIAKSQPSEAQILSDVSIIRKHTEQCRRVVEALLNFSRAAEPRKKITDINACIEEVISVMDLQLQKENFTIVRQFDTTLPNITVDGNKIKQVLMNLLINASQAMPEGGCITVSTALKAGARQLAIAISDTGSGISKDNLPKIFDPFFTTKGPEKGTGLGLSVSYGIIQRHGGRISVESTPGKGTTFTILLPAEAS
jgi:two-component system, NtrC family, sensor kinase